jgi:hypothetical protein
MQEQNPSSQGVYESHGKEQRYRKQQHWPRVPQHTIGVGQHDNFQASPNSQQQQHMPNSDSSNSLISLLLRSSHAHASCMQVQLQHTRFFTRVDKHCVPHCCW